MSVGASPAFTLVHALMACGGPDGQGRWCAPKRSPTLLFPVHALSKVLRGKRPRRTGARRPGGQAAARPGLPHRRGNGDLQRRAELDDQHASRIGTDAEQIEINPLAVCKGANGDELLVLDAKVSFDGNAMFRHKDLSSLRDLSEEDPAEVEASEYDLAYIKLDGNIGCMVNGAGLAMATMDIIKLNGEFPANFLDVGGGASKEKVTAAFKIILKDPAVKGILVNIFGGIMKCDIIADGIVAAAKEVNLSVPLVVRLEGTNVQQGKDILANSGLPIVSANDLGDAAEKIVAEVRKAA